MIRRLRSVEIDSYDHLDRDLARRVRLVGIPALPGRYLGITLGTFVLLATDEPADGSSVLIAHELVHVRQWSEDGRVRFAFRYVRAFAANLARYRRWHAAYRNIPAEIEARTVASEWSRRRSTADRRNL